MALQITSAGVDPALLDLPWRLPLEEWPEEILAALPRGISRHVVRFVRLSGRVVAIKEIKAEIASREYHMLRNLQRLDLPTVEPEDAAVGRPRDEHMGDGVIGPFAEHHRHAALQCGIAIFSPAHAILSRRFELG